MDWTLSPLVALYFAVKPDGPDGEYVHEEAAVVATSTSMRIDPQNPRSILADISVDPLTVSEPQFYYPPHFTERIRAQDSLFSISDPRVDIEDLLMGHRLVIAGDDRAKMWDDLQRMGVTERALFPGLESTARWIKSLKFAPPGA